MGTLNAAFNDIDQLEMPVPVAPHIVRRVQRIAAGFSHTLSGPGLLKDEAGAARFRFRHVLSVGQLPAACFNP